MGRIYDQDRQPRDRDGMCLLPEIVVRYALGQLARNTSPVSPRAHTEAMDALGHALARFIVDGDPTPAHGIRRIK